MGYDIPLGYSRVTFKHQAASTLGSDIVWGFGCSLTPSIDNVTLFRGFWETQLQSSTSNVLTCLSVEMRDNFSAYEAPVLLSGLNDAPYPPPQTCALVRLVTGKIGRSNRGRIYLPYLVNEANLTTDGQLSDGALANVQSIMGELYELVQDLGGSIVILHSTESTPTPGAVPIAQRQVATQRRRNRR